MRDQRPESELDVTHAPSRPRAWDAFVKPSLRRLASSCLVAGLQGGVAVSLQRAGRARVLQIGSVLREIGLCKGLRCWHPRWCDPEGCLLLLESVCRSSQVPRYYFKAASAVLSSSC